jgi:hypothetical protein
LGASRTGHSTTALVDLEGEQRSGAPIQKTQLTKDGVMGDHLGGQRHSGLREQFSVSGKQEVLNEKAGHLEDDPAVCSATGRSHRLRNWPKLRFKAKGTESFNGCIDRNLDRSCAGDPGGTMKFSFRYWGKFSAKDAVELGTCAHPVTGGTGAFAGASGFLMMVDTPTKKAPFVMTEYEGVITLSGKIGSARVSANPTPCK